MGEIHCRCDKGHGYTAPEEYVKNGGTCPVCLIAKGVKVIKGYNDVWTMYPELAREMYYRDTDKLVKLKNVYRWECPKCGSIWRASLEEKLKGASCPNCKKLIAKKSKTSYKQIDW